MAKHSLARSAREVYVSPEHKLTGDSRCGPDVLTLYIFFKTAGDGWQFAKMVGLAQQDVESVIFPHTIKMLFWGRQFDVHFRRDQLKATDVSDDPGT